MICGEQLEIAKNFKINNNFHVAVVNKSHWSLKQLMDYKKSNFFEA